MTTLGEIRDAAAGQLNDHVGGISFYPRLPVRMQLPAGFLRRLSGPTPRTFDSWAVSFELVVIVSGALGERASEVLDEYAEAAGDGSIRDALESDPTLGGIAEGLMVGDWGEEEIVAVNDVDYPGSVLPFEVYYES